MFSDFQVLELRVAGSSLVPCGCEWLLRVTSVQVSKDKVSTASHDLNS